MLLRDTQRLTALRAMQVFLDAHETELRGWDSGGARKSLDQITERLGTLAVKQEAEGLSSRGERHNETVLANRLRRNFFRPIIDAARAMGEKIDLPKSIPFPHRRTNTTR